MPNPPSEDEAGKASSQPDGPQVGPAPRPAGGDRDGVPAHTLFKRLLIGRPLATDQAVHQRLRKLVALPVFSSDAISSTGYACVVTLSRNVLSGLSLGCSKQRPVPSNFQP